MRPPAVPAVAVALVTVLALASPALSSAPSGTPSGPHRLSASQGASASASPRGRAERALRPAAELLSGQRTRTDASMALLRLRLTMHSLAPADRRRAAAILARPTDPADPY